MTNEIRRKKLALLFALMMILSVMTNVQAADGSLYVVAVCRDANSVEIIDGDSMKSLARIPVGEAPHEAIVSADGRTAYVTNYGTQGKPGNSLSIIDLVALKETKRVDLGDLTRPHGLQIIGGKIYFTAEASKTVARFDPMTGKVDWQAKTDQMISHMLAVSADGKKIYTANIVSGSVTAIDASGAEAKITQITVGKEPEGIALAPDGKTLWVGHRAAGLITVIDTATNKVTETLTAGQMPLRVSFAPDGKRVYAINPQEGAVVVFDAATRKEVGRITIDGAPVGLAVAPDSKRVFVTDLKNSKVFAALDAQKLSPTNSVSVETLSDGIGLGFAGKSAVNVPSTRSATDDQAQKILAKARAAMGDEAKLKTAESLSAEGTYKREGGGQTADGGLNLYFNRTGQYARSEFFSPPQGGKVFFDRILDGEKGWLKPRLDGNDKIQFTGFDDEKTQAEERDRMFIDYSAQLLAFLLAAPPQIDLAYAGKLTVGDTTFEVVEARGPKNFAAKLFLELNTFRLAKLTYRGYLQRPMGTKRVNRQPDGSLADEAGNQPGESEKPQNEEITLTVAEYKSVDGISLPHRVTRSVADGALETWELKTFRLNAPKPAGLK